MSVPLGQEWLLKDEVLEERDPGEGAEEPSEGLSTMSAVVMNVNMVIGAGVVGLPYAFYHAGAFLSIGALLVATLMASASMGYLVEVMAWCEAMQKEDEEKAEPNSEAAAENGQAERGNGASTQQGQEGAERDGESPNQAAENTEERDAAERSGEEGKDEGADGDGVGVEGLVFRGRKMELSELCGYVFPCQVDEDSWLRRLGDERGRLQVVRRVLEISLLCYTLGSCWLYATVFASSLSLVVPLPISGRPTALANCLIKCPARETEAACSAPCVWSNASSCEATPAMAKYCNESYELFLVLFAVLMLSLACLDMKGLKNIQIGMGLLALGSLLTMIVTCFVSIFHDTGTMAGSDRIPTTNLDGMGKLVTAAIFSQINHQATPSIVSAMQEKRNAKLVFRCTLYYTFTLYVLLCFVTTYYFGDKTVPIITLNWEDYTGGSAPGAPISWWATAIATSVLVFPVVSVSAAFPLNVIPLAQTVQQMFASSTRPPEQSSTLLLRVGFSLLPILLASAVKDVSKILEFNGMCGFVMAFFVPCALYIACRANAIQRWGAKAAKNGHWSWPASTVWCVWAVLLVSVVVAAYTLYQVVLDYAGRGHR